jgi:hypothetical protein
MLLAFSPKSPTELGESRGYVGGGSALNVMLQTPAGKSLRDVARALQIFFAATGSICMWLVVYASTSPVIRNSDVSHSTCQGLEINKNDGQQLP